MKMTAKRWVERRSDWPSVRRYFLPGLAVGLASSLLLPDIDLDRTAPEPAQAGTAFASASPALDPGRELRSNSRAEATWSAGTALPGGVAPTAWTDVGVLGYVDGDLGRKLSYPDLKTDVQPLIDSGVVRRSGSSFDVVKDGAEIVGYDFPVGTNLRIRAANVSLKRNRIRAGSSATHPGAVYFQNLAPGIARDGSPSTVVIEDNEISGGRFAIYPSFQGVRLLARRNAILANTIDPRTGRPSAADLDMADGIDWRGSFNQIEDEAAASVIEQNWIGGFLNGSSGHHYDGIATVGGGNLKIRWNRIEAYGVTQTVGIRVISDIAPVQNVWVEGNVFAGFGYSLGIGWGNPTHSDSGEVTGIHVHNNVSEAGTYQSGPLTVAHVDERTGDRVVQLTGENNTCVPPSHVEDLHPRWRALDAEDLTRRCNEKFSFR